MIDNNNPYNRFKGIAHYKDDNNKSICGDPINKNQSDYWNNNTNYCIKCEKIVGEWFK